MFEGLLLLLVFRTLFFVETITEFICAETGVMCQDLPAFSCAQVMTRLEVMRTGTERMYNMTVRSGCSCAAVRPIIHQLRGGPREK